MKPIPFNINNGNLIKTLTNKNFQYLASQLDSVAELHRKVCTHEGEIRSLKELYRIKVQNQAFFSDLSKRTPLSPTFTSLVHPMKQNINPTFLEINETKNSVYIRLLAYRDACLTGDAKQIALLSSQTYVENTTSSEPFHSFEFEFKKKIFEVAQNENRFITSSSLSFYGLQQAASMREIPKNLFVDKNSNIDTKGQSSYNTVQELAVTSLIASGHTHYLYYVTCDRSQQDIDNWLTSARHVCVHCSVARLRDTPPSSDHLCLFPLDPLDQSGRRFHPLIRRRPL
ncbi:MAG: hypothetical protein EOO35_00775 [Cyanobacteriota bacterium]|nr:MAG: hypothetical protein EOO35_00775 [Cyanobacteriota bacterium]